MFDIDLGSFRAQAIAVFCMLAVLFTVQKIYADSDPCSGPKEFKKETGDCVYDVSYPVLLNKKMECKIREFINDKMERFGGGPGIDPDMGGNKNEFTIGYKIIEWNGFENVVLNYYEYAQGAHGANAIWTFTYDVKSGNEYEIFDVIDRKKDWLNVLLPIMNRTEIKGFGQLNLDEKAVEQNQFKEFVIDDGNLILCFDRCDLVPCAYGNVKIPIPLKEIEDILKFKFKNIVKDSLPSK